MSDWATASPLYPATNVFGLNLPFNNFNCFTSTVSVSCTKHIELRLHQFGLCLAFIQLRRKRRMLKILVSRTSDDQGRWRREVSMVAIHRIQRNALILAILVFLATPLVAQDTTASDPQSASETPDAQLQKDVQNPVASLTLVPLQNN